MKYKRPESYKNRDREELSPVSLRIRKSKKGTLEKAAEKAGMSLNELLSGVIEEYADFLEKN